MCNLPDSIHKMVNVTVENPPKKFWYTKLVIFMPLLFAFVCEILDRLFFEAWDFILKGAVWDLVASSGELADCTQLNISSEYTTSLYGGLQITKDIKSLSLESVSGLQHGGLRLPKGSHNAS